MLGGSKKTWRSVGERRGGNVLGCGEVLESVLGCGGGKCWEKREKV